MHFTEEQSQAYFSLPKNIFFEPKLTPEDDFFSEMQRKSTKTLATISSDVGSEPDFQAKNECLITYNDQTIVLNIHAEEVGF
jgi:hypothetical protein